MMSVRQKIGISLFLCLFGVRLWAAGDPAASAAGPSWRARCFLSPTAAAAEEDGSYAYGSSHFTEFVVQSYRYRQAGEPDGFSAWMERAYERDPFLGGPGLRLEALLDSKRRDLGALSNRSQRAEAEKALGWRLHRWVKKAIPHYSLSQGYEFVCAVRDGGRQCFLQSVLIAGLLQRMGTDAGVAMVYRSSRGEAINNSHAVTLVKLSNGRDIVVDASHEEPFIRQRGLLVRLSDYRYADLVYDGTSPEILMYRPAGGKKELPPAEVRPLDVRFLHSQFWYYRGERAKGGLLADAPTKAGLEESVRCLRTSVQWCPQNPLPVYMLGRAYLAQGNTPQAREAFSQAVELYSRCGWVPQGPKEYLRLNSFRPRR